MNQLDNNCLRNLGSQASNIEERKQVASIHFVPILILKGNAKLVCLLSLELLCHWLRITSISHSALKSNLHKFPLILWQTGKAWLLSGKGSVNPPNKELHVVCVFTVKASIYLHDTMSHVVAWIWYIFFCSFTLFCHLCTPLPDMLFPEDNSFF